MDIKYILIINYPGREFLTINNLHSSFENARKKMREEVRRFQKSFLDREFEIDEVPLDEDSSNGCVQKRHYFDTSGKPM